MNAKYMQGNEFKGCWKLKGMVALLKYSKPF